MYTLYLTPIASSRIKFTFPFQVQHILKKMCMHICYCADVYVFSPCMVEENQNYQFFVWIYFSFYFWKDLPWIIAGGDNLNSIKYPYDKVLIADTEMKL